MSGSFVIFDCEWLTDEGSNSRFWCGPHDPDQVLVQIGAVKVAITDSVEIAELFSMLVKPVDRFNAPHPVSAFFTQLTQITPERIQAEGKPVQEVLTQFAEFCGSDMVWAWGKDENVAMALAAFYGGFPPTLPATQFDNMSKIFLKAGMEHDVLVKTRSNQLAAHFGVDPGELTAHDGLDDALSIFHALKFLVDQKKVNPAWLLKPFSK
jgi:DNA polymerase III epsilon subunit-like protein